MTDAPRGRVDDAEHGEFVAGVGQRFQVRHQVAGFAAVEKRLAAQQDVRHVLAAEFCFEHTWLIVGPEQDGDVARHDAEFADLVSNLAHDSFRFGLLVRVRTEHHACAGFVCAEGFVVAAFVVTNEPVGEFENLICAAVVLFQSNRFGAGEVL